MLLLHTPSLCNWFLFFIEADVANDGVGEIMVNVVTRSFHSYLDIFFCVRFRIHLIRSLCPCLVMDSSIKRKKDCVVSQRCNVEGLRRTAYLNPRQKFQKSSSSG